ncbi:hypothetical protein ACFTAO_21205 [Paenibacillus rhizoplanae]
MLELFSSQNVSNDTGWSNAGYDRYMQQARQAANPGTRMQIYATAEKLLMDQMAVIPLFLQCD